MRAVCCLLLVASALSTTARAQGACTPSALPEAAKAVAAVRHTLHEKAVGELDPNVPAEVATQLGWLKDNLAKAAAATFSCAGSAASAEELQKTLADALHANLSTASETAIVTRDKKDQGAYGSDLAVQVFPLFSSPKFYEVDFRYGVECGDDNLLLVFQAGAGGSASGWNEVLRWSAPAYKTVADAYGDFVLLTPLSGFPGERNWRFVVAHGQPGCSASASGPSHFDLDLLEPTSDPARPDVVWHLERPYSRAAEPRLSTTEDTLTFELATPEHPGKGAKRPAEAERLRFHVSKDNHVEPLSGAQPDQASGSAPAAPLSTGSPQ